MGGLCWLLQLAHSSRPFMPVELYGHLTLSHGHFQPGLKLCSVVGCQGLGWLPEAFLRSCAGSFKWEGRTERVGRKGRFFSLSFEALVYQVFTFPNCTNETSSCGFLFYLLFWSFSLNFSTSISRQWLLISSCRSHL